ncbi:MAG: hypothetical protein PQJ58_08905 [Spirochaetales bacterium]|nr:hypothetical protein [Spirochaetales bacterium]
MKKLLIIMAAALVMTSCMSTDTGNAGTIEASPAGMQFDQGELKPSGPESWANLGAVQIRQGASGVAVYGENTQWGVDMIYQGRVQPDHLQLELKPVTMNAVAGAQYPALDNDRMVFAIGQRGESLPDGQGFLIQMTKLEEGLVIEVYTALGEFVPFGAGPMPIEPVLSKSGTWYLDMWRDEANWHFLLSSDSDPGRESLVGIEFLPAETFRNGSAGLGFGMQSSGVMEVELAVRQRN